MAKKTGNADWNKKPGSDAQLTFILKILNSSQMGAELTKLVELWLASGPKLAYMLAQHPDVAKELAEGKTLFVPTGIGGVMIATPAGAGDGDLKSRKSALAMFTTLMIHPMLRMFEGQCSKCGLFYSRKTKRETIFCSLACARSVSAVKAMKEKRALEHERKVEKVRKAAGTMSEIAWRRPTWKIALAAKADVSTKWLTRAINNGQIKVPSTAETTLPN